MALAATMLPQTGHLATSFVDGGGWPDEDELGRLGLAGFGDIEDGLDVSAGLRCEAFGKGAGLPWFALAHFNLAISRAESEAGAVPPPRTAPPVDPVGPLALLPAAFITVPAPAELSFDRHPGFTT